MKLWAERFYSWNRNDYLSYEKRVEKLLERQKVKRKEKLRVRPLAKRG